MTSSTIELNNAAIGYSDKGKETLIMSGLNAALRRGELTCLLGPNGAGKSTLLRTMSAFQPLLGGDVRLMGKSLAEHTNSELSRIVSVVLTDNSSIKNMNVREVVSMGRSPYTGFWGKMSSTDTDMVERSISMVGIETLADRMMQTLSDGERQKVMIAKSIAQDTPIILLDEPTAFLDYPSKIAMMLMLRNLAQTLGKSIFLSTHDLEHALQVADQIWLLDKQLGLTTGTPQDLSTNGDVERYFVCDGLHFDRQSRTFHLCK